MGKQDYQEMKDAEIWVQVIAQEFTDEDGKVHRKLKWQRLDRPLSLGSIAKPQNQQVVGFKVVSNEPVDIKNFFGGFKGLFG